MILYYHSNYYGCTWYSDGDVFAFRLLPRCSGTGHFCCQLYTATYPPIAFTNTATACGHAVGCALRGVG